MSKRRLLAVAAGFAALSAASQAFANCSISKIIELPVTMQGLKPTIPAKVNGKDETFIVDSGAQFSFITSAAAAELALKHEPMPPGYTVTGFGGAADMSLTHVKDFTLEGSTIHDVQFMVGWSGRDAGNIGRNLLGFADVEYDLSNGAIRMFKPTGCGYKYSLAYWAKDLPFSVIDITTPEQATRRIDSVAYVNGVRIRVTFDTGAPISILSLDAAKRVGIDVHDPAAVADDSISGLGTRSYQSWVAPVKTFKIGDEEVQNSRLRVVEHDINNADMMIGADFFLSHRIYVSQAQNKIYFTYNGGRVFDLTTQLPADAPSAAAKPDSPTSAVTAPADAEGFARRGAAFAARKQFTEAIADLTRACDMAPAQADYFYQRAQAYEGSGQVFLAMADLNQAVKLQPDNLATRLARAQLKLRGHDAAGAIVDLDLVDHGVPRDSDKHLELAKPYLDARALPAALTQYDLWIGSHPHDSRQPDALNGRCWARALWNQDLDKALADCNAALRLDPKNIDALSSRGLVHLRRGEFDLAIADYDLAISLRSKAPWSLYGRGLAKLRKGQISDGQTDITAAVALNSGLPDEAKSHGLTP